MCLNFRKAYPSYILAVLDTVFSEFCEKSEVEEWKSCLLLTSGITVEKQGVKAMNTPFPELVGKVVSSFEVEHSDSGAARDIKAVKVVFNDGSSIKLEFQIGMAIAKLGSTPFPNFVNEIQLKGGGMHLE